MNNEYWTIYRIELYIHITRGAEILPQMYSLQGRISQIVGNELNSANEQQGLGVAVLVLVLIISPVIIFLVRSATITIQVKRGDHDLF